MNCPFCQGPTTLIDLSSEMEVLSHPKDDPKYEYYHEDRTCLACQTPECSLEFNFIIHKDPTKKPELINYCLKHAGYTAWIGVKRPMTEITHDWHTSHYLGSNMMTMCYPILMTEKYSLNLTPENFPRRLKTILVFQ